MPVALPVTKKITGKVSWTRGGSPAPAPAGLTVSISDPSKASLITYSDGSFELDPLHGGDVVVTVSGTGGAASDTVTIVEEPLVGTFVWSQPF